MRIHVSATNLYTETSTISWPHTPAALASPHQIVPGIAKETLCSRASPPTNRFNQVQP